MWIVSYCGTHRANSQLFGQSYKSRARDLDLEHILDARSPGDHCVQVWLQSSHLSARRSNFRASTKVPVSRDLWPWPWPWAHPVCMLTWRPSCASLVAIRLFAFGKKWFSCQHKCLYHVTFNLDLEHTLDARSPGDHCVQVWLQSSHLCRRSDLCKTFTVRQTDDGRHAMALAHGMS